MNLQTFFANILIFLNKTILPALLAVAFLVFIWNVARYFILGGANSEDQAKAKLLAFWGVLAFALIVSFWGIVNMFVDGFNLYQQSPVTPDYMTTKNYFFDSGSYGD